MHHYNHIQDIAVIRCLKCQATTPAPTHTCANCESIVAQKDGIPLFSPEISDDGDGFSPDMHSHLFDIEEKSPWFIWRSKLINFMIRKYGSGGGRYCEIGCGNGYVLGTTKHEFPNLEIWGTEMLFQGLSNTKTRHPDIHLFQSDATNFPFLEHFDMIGAYDVLEHIANDEDAIRNIHRALKPSGSFIITVPQHMFLWSFADDIACHQRRYSRKEMREKLELNGFKLCYMSSYAFILMPVLWVTRCLSHKKTNREDALKTSVSQLSPSWPARFVMTLCFGAEYYLNKLGLRIPFGGSLICVAKKI